MRSAVQAVGLTFDQAKGATAAEVQAWIVQTAKREHGEIMRTEPLPKTFRRFVDGVEGAKEESVRSTGFIRYLYARLDMVVQFAMETLFDLSPVDSGAYRSSHQLFVGGSLTASMADWRPDEEIMIANTMPYARKIEFGSMNMRVPGSEMVYQQAAKIVRRRFGRIASVAFNYRGITGTSSLRSGRAKADQRYPVLIIGEL